MTPRTLRNWIYLGLLSITAMAMACQCFGAVSQDANGWTVVTYPPSGGGEMWFCDQDGGLDTNDGRDPNGFDLSTATYTHSTRTLTSSGAFSGYTHTGGDRTDVIYITGATGGVATGYYIIESKTSNDAIVLEAAAGLTADATGVSSSDGPESTVAAGKAHMQGAEDDQLLLQRGDTWTNEILGSFNSGVSLDEPTLYGAYGPLTDARPKILTDPSSAVSNNTSVSYVAVIGLHLEPNDRENNNAEKDGIRVANNSYGGFYFEDNYIAGYVKNLNIAAADSGAVGTRTWGGNQIRYGQPQTCKYDMQGLLVKHGKTIADITRATFQLKRNPRARDQTADFNRNSVDHPLQVSFAMEEVTVEDGSTESHLIVTTTINTTDFGKSGGKLRPDVTYHESCSLMFSGDAVTTYELDTYPTDNQVKFLQDRVE